MPKDRTGGATQLASAAPRALALQWRLPARLLCHFHYCAEAVSSPLLPHHHHHIAGAASISTSTVSSRAASPPANTFFIIPATHPLRCSRACTSRSLLPQQLPASHSP